jgi:hypothetical protein
LEEGSRRVQGERTDLSKLRTDVLNGSKVKDILLENELNAGDIRVAQTFFTYLEPERNSKPTVYWYFGPTGTGKSKKASEFNDVYWKDDTKWWEGYDRQETVVLDDFRASNVKFNHLLKLLDRYPMRVENKGGYRQLNSKTIIITTNRHPKDCYNLTDEQIEKLLRRIDVIEHFIIDPISDYFLSQNQKSK